MAVAAVQDGELFSGRGAGVVKAIEHLESVEVVGQHGKGSWGE